MHSYLRLIIDFWPLFAFFAIAILAGFYFIVVRPQMEENRRKIAVQHAAEPRLILQYDEHETDYLARVQRAQAQYLDAGNKWAKVQTPVVYYPMNTVVEFEWFGVTYRESNIGLTHEEYRKAGEAFFQKMKLIWHEKAVAAHGMEKALKARGQKPLDPDDPLWE